MISEHQKGKKEEINSKLSNYKIYGFQRFVFGHFLYFYDHSPTFSETRYDIIRYLHIFHIIELKSVKFHQRQHFYFPVHNFFAPHHNKYIMEWAIMKKHLHGFSVYIFWPIYKIIFFLYVHKFNIMCICLVSVRLRA